MNVRFCRCGQAISPDYHDHIELCDDCYARCGDWLNGAKGGKLDGRQKSESDNRSNAAK